MSMSPVTGISQYTIIAAIQQQTVTMPNIRNNVITDPSFTLLLIVSVTLAVGCGVRSEQS